MSSGSLNGEWRSTKCLKNNEAYMLDWNKRLIRLILSISSARQRLGQKPKVILHSFSQQLEMEVLLCDKLIPILAQYLVRYFVILHNLPFLSDTADQVIRQGKRHPSVSRVGHGAGP